MLRIHFNSRMQQFSQQNFLSFHIRREEHIHTTSKLWCAKAWECNTSSMAPLFVLRGVNMPSVAGCEIIFPINTTDSESGRKCHQKMMSARLLNENMLANRWEIFELAIKKKMKSMLHLDIYHVYIRLVLNFVLPLFHIQMTNGNQINGRANWTYDENVNNLFFFLLHSVIAANMMKGHCLLCAVCGEGRTSKKKSGTQKMNVQNEQRRTEIPFPPIKISQITYISFFVYANTRIYITTQCRICMICVCCVCKCFEH